MHYTGLTVKEVRDLIATLPDDMEVWKTDSEYPTEAACGIEMREVDVSDRLKDNVPSPISRRVVVIL